jgi:hypothetical protein
MWPDDDDTPEPAAWINFNAATSERNVSFACESELASIPLWPESPRTQRKPLTEEEIISAAKQTNSAEPGREGYILPILFARAIERAHGIGDNT